MQNIAKDEISIIDKTVLSTKIIIDRRELAINIRKV